MTVAPAGTVLSKPAKQQKNNSFVYFKVSSVLKVECRTVLNCGQNMPYDIILSIPTNLANTI